MLKRKRGGRGVEERYPFLAEISHNVAYKFDSFREKTSLREQMNAE